MICICMRFVFVGVGMQARVFAGTVAFKKAVERGGPKDDESNQAER